MSAPWEIRKLLRALSARGGHPAVISYGEGKTLTWDSETLARNSLRLARSLRETGLGRDARVALWAPNSPVWISSALGVLACGGVLVPVDDLADAAQLEAALASSDPRLVLTTARHLEIAGDILRKRAIGVVLIDAPEYGGGEAASLSATCEHVEDLPVPSWDAPAMLSWTSGTTGSPKAFLLTHGNIATNVAALRDLAVVGPEDRALLPLPLHHAYPFVVGMLTTLTLGTSIVLPGGTTGPALMRAIHDGQVTAIVGVPRLYEALEAAIEASVNAHGRILRLAWRLALSLVTKLQRSTGMRWGRLLFAPLRRGLAPRLRLLVSGGARLGKQVEEKLEALGWTVLSGYGLAETASLFTGNRPNDRRLGSVGRPLADGEVRIADPDDQGVGEIELRGNSITRGYLDNPEANRETFASDGWFRTGDLGFVDRDSFLFVSGRVKETLVLGGGKKVNPEDLERIYGGVPEILELALLEDNGALVALVRPDAAKLRQRGATNLRDGVRVLLGEQAQNLPSYQRLSGFALTDQPLPRTRLGKYRRFLLSKLYAQAAGGAARRPAHVRGPEDAALLRDPTAAAVWSLLRQRYPEEAIDLDVNLGLDMNLDSFGWMELTILLQDRLGVHLVESDIAGIETIRDLLRRSIDHRPLAAREKPAIATDVERWLAPPGAFLRIAGAGLYALNWLAMRALFRLRATGVEGLPGSGPFVITPNHVSYLDGLAIAAALPFRRFRQLYWAGDVRLLFCNPLARAFARAVHVFPVDATYPDAALHAADRVLRAGNAQVWFPEGWRSPDGTLQRFLPGIGELLLRSRAPVVPAYIGGAFAALPRHRHLPRFKRISVIFGSPYWPEALRVVGPGGTDEERIANALRAQVSALGEATGVQLQDDTAAARSPFTHR
jgi:long-chain acyl-CoA synthetase